MTGKFLKKVISLIAGLSFILGGCATPALYTHTVKWKNESLSIIAGWYTGDRNNWRALSEANPGVNTERIDVGTKVTIPEALLKTKTSMTKEYVDSFYPKPRKAPELIPPSQMKKESSDLYGPKGYQKK